MRKHIIFCVIAVLFSFHAAKGSQIETEKQIKSMQPHFIEQEDTFYADSWFEYSWIKQGERKFNWRTLSNRFAYLYNDLQCPYAEITRHERAGIEDYTGIIGAVLKGEDSYGIMEIGFGGPEIDFIYTFQSSGEYAHRIVENLYWKAGARYLHYRENDVYIASPGLVNYFGNHYLSADYNLSVTESRDSAQWATLKGNYNVNERINLWLGSAIGERLYDIYPLKASKQYSYIIFNGVDVAVTHNINARVGFSYSMEKPQFIKRSIEFSLSIKF